MKYFLQRNDNHAWITSTTLTKRIHSEKIYMKGNYKNAFT